MEINKKQQVGSLNISRSVVEQVAKMVVREVDGVAALVQAPKSVKEVLLNTKPSPVRLSTEGDVAQIDVYILVKPDHRIREVAEKIQSYIKDNVQNMTGIAVSCVNVYVRGIKYSEV